MADRTSAVLGAIVKNFGKGVAGSGTHIAPTRRRVPVGILALDIGLGGGLAVGTTTLLYGDEGSGKTTTALRAAGVFQGLCRRCLRPALNVCAVRPEADSDRWTAQGFCDCVEQGLVPIPEPPPKESGEKPAAYRERCELFEEAYRANSYEETIVLWLDVENSFDHEWATRQGMDPRRVLLVQPTTAEEATDIAKAFALSSTVDFLVIDSLAQMTPSKEIEESMEKWQQGLAARITNKAMRSLVVGAVQTKRQGGHGLTQIYINQLRMKIGVLWGDPTTIPGGLGQRFTAKTEVRFLNSKSEMESVQYGAKDEVVKIPTREKIRFKITKNNTASMGTFEGDYLMVSRPDERYEIGDVDDDDRYFAMAMHYCVTKEKGAGYAVFGRSYPTQDALKNGLVVDRELRAEVRDYLFQKIVWGK